ncbi:pyruvate dehydrogenase X component [Rhizoctonia solani AG-3 Rhs1AP]|uniref:Pyruvate dehydrogenase X component n=2 Tax=Rhizoctonia solani AG-3 TaxID=1086053 RepID=A0A074S6N2_9AGAM|nr:pyruvate dehydrogenase X component [Rhizoctonia solani AG-3 Rhs1AP]KEP54889.1 pyruvate dehydrogenase X component [Rhizoctonia solani 123E]
MAAFYAVRKAALQARGIRALHGSVQRTAVSKFLFPAMSPTMTEGGIASWKKKEGESFSAGDILLEIETDKATMDVEAQDDGVLGKILVENGAKSVSVGTLIALLAEEGDDISNIQPPAESESESSKSPKKEDQSTSASSAATAPTSRSSPSAPESATPNSPHHDFPKGPLFPSVMRLLAQHHVSSKDAKKIKGTGVRGMLTKGDILAHLGLASTPTGTFKVTQPKDTPATVSKTGTKAEAPKKIDAPTLRKLIIEGMILRADKSRAAPKSPPAMFDSIIDDYLPPKPAGVKLPVIPPTTSARHGYFDGLL